MKPKINEVVSFQLWERTFKGTIEKELLNTYIISVQTRDQKFNDLYHGRMAIRKKNVSQIIGE